MAEFCREHNIHLLAYGTLAGGLLSDRYMGQPEPSAVALNTASLRKYKRMVDVWGGWGLFQELLSVLRQVATRHGASIANVATRYVLDRPAVAGVIIGARLGVADHREENAKTFNIVLDGEDHEMIENVLRRSNDLYRLIGDCGAEYR
jgi:aryl-alcohol dehydrogenase-like predicted oxidoreductase